MKEIHFDDIARTVAELAIEACYRLPDDMVAAMRAARTREPSPVGRNILDQLLENAEIAARGDLPLCQDTGLAVVFAEVGQDVRIVGGAFEDAINEGIRKGYTEGYLRKSCVDEPLFERKNTRDNTPAVIHMRKVVLDAVLAAGPNSCPPLVIGVGIGGTMEMAAICAKRAAARDLESRNHDPRYAAFEDELLEMVNKTGVGPQGLGGITTALKVHVEWAPTHIASLPVAVNINCHAARHAEAVL